MISELKDFWALWNFLHIEKKKISEDLLTSFKVYNIIRSILLFILLKVFLQKVL